MPKNIIISLTTFIISFIGLFLYMGFNRPNAVQVSSILFVLILLYATSVSFIYTLMAFIKSNNSIFVLHVSLLLGCVLPILIILNSLKQASVFDLLLVILTFALILWYSLSKR